MSIADGDDKMRRAEVLRRENRLRARIRQDLVISVDESPRHLRSESIDSSRGIELMKGMQLLSSAPSHQAKQSQFP